MLAYLYSIYKISFKFFKIRYAIKYKVNSPVLVINFGPKAFGRVRLIFAPIDRIFFQYYKGVYSLLQNETCAKSAYRLLIQLRKL